MLSKDELIKSVAQSCGVSIEISSFFFEVFVNRLSNKLKPGELLHFHNFGYFHKRNCRIQIEKSSESPTPKSYLIQLVLYSSDTKIRSDLSDLQFLKIPNLKTLWVDDKEFQRSLKSGDFAPYDDRNQLIKSFATKAEVIISSLRKDYDSELVEELIIPLTFDLNFLVKSGRRNVSTESNSKSTVTAEPNFKVEKKSEETVPAKEKVRIEKVTSKGSEKETTENGLPWNYGTKFLEKDKVPHSKAIVDKDKNQELADPRSNTSGVNDFRKEQEARLKDFEPVNTHHPTPKPESKKVKTSATVKFSVHQSTSDESDASNSSSKFTEVKSKTESYHQRGEFGKSKNRYDRYSSRRLSNEKAFTARRNYLPIVAAVAFIIIALIVVYIYFIKSDGNTANAESILTGITPPDNVNVIDRDYDVVVSYPYPKMGNRIEMSGFGDDIFSNVALTTDMKKDLKPEVKPEIKTEKVTQLNEKPKVETKTVPLAEEKSKPKVETKTEDVSRIFLNKNFYVVYVGSYTSEASADREADKYFDLGYNAFIEETQTRDGKAVYRLNVGDFTSEDFAKQFQEKYLK